MEDDEDDYVDVYEMACVVAEWDGERGYMLSEDGERISLSRRKLARQGVTVPLKVGDRIHCWVTAETTFSLEKIRVIEPKEPDTDHIRWLKELGKKIVARHHGRLMAEVQFTDTFNRTIESHNKRKKSGVIRRDDGERLKFERVCLGWRHREKIEPGMLVRFEAWRFDDTWSVLRIISLSTPAD